MSQQFKTPQINAPTIAITLAVLAGVGVMFFVEHVNGIQDEAEAEIERMGCGELKDFILREGWDDYSARWSKIESKAYHEYEWRCEK